MEFKPSARLFSALAPLLIALSLVAPSFGQVKIPSGTNIPVTLDEDITVKSDNFGKTYRVKVTRPVVVNGKVAIEKDSEARVKLIQDKQNKDKATMRLDSVRIDGHEYPTSSDVARPGTDEDKGKNHTGTGAAVGAGVGLLTGSGLIKGAALGAGGGLIWNMMDGGGDRKVKSGAKLDFKLTETIIKR